MFQCLTEKLDRLSNEDFLRLGGLIQEQFGIRMPMSKKLMLESRLRKRLYSLGLRSFNEYCHLLFGGNDAQEELVLLIDAVTTNKTDFFREPEHFHYLLVAVLPELTEKGAGMEREFLIWSAGCSTGEEPYSLAMALAEYGVKRPGFHYSVLATDISTQAIMKARVGIYDESRIGPVPEEMRKKYLLRSRNRSKGVVRIAPSLRESVLFRRLNFNMDDYGIGRPVDIVFCRNVMIYFDRKVQTALISRICLHLSDGGYLFTGHSEALHGMDVPLAQVATAVYRKTG